MKFGEGDTLTGEEDIEQNPFLSSEGSYTYVTMRQGYKRSRDYQTVEFEVSISIPCDLARIEEVADYENKMCDYLINKYSGDVEEGLKGLCKDAGNRR